MASITEEKRTYESPPMRSPGTRETPVGEIHPEMAPPAEEPLRDLVRGATAEGFFAGGAAVLSILGLAGFAPKRCWPSRSSASARLSCSRAWP